MLSGDDPKLFGTRLTDLLTGRNPRGGSVELTLEQGRAEGRVQRDEGQRTASSRRGAVVALDPRTGAILAAVSTPSYDPNQLSPHNPSDDHEDLRAAAATDPSQPLLNRAFNQLYPPGSTFKIVVVGGGAQGRASRPTRS